VKETQFIASREAEWEAWDRWLERAARRGETPVIAPAELPRRFRCLCQDLAIAGERQYSSLLLDALRRRVAAAHQRIYGAQPRQGGAFARFLAAGFPSLVREQWRAVLAAALLFFVPLLIYLALLQWRPDAVFFVLSPDLVGEVEEMYEPGAQRPGRPRDAADDWQMWGYYIYNNVRIDFQCFAGGIAFGLGSIFFLVYNGLVIGAVAGHLTQLGYVETFWGFVAGHSAFELIGAVLAGAAGLRIGMALVAPGRRRRLDAVKEDGRVAVRLLGGAAMMTFAAAFIEAFWSPLAGVPVGLKYAVGIGLWLLLGAYFLLAGRGVRDAARR
jgi:uncharacterized membrane protein SpoIIM required for sporulation